MKFNIKKIIIILLFSSALLAGTIFLFLGIKETVSLAVKTKDWFDAPGYFRDYSIYDVDDDGKTTYRLKYVFYSGGAEYFIETDYGSEIIPEIDSVRTVLYEPENPENAIIKGGESSSVYLTIGVMFTAIPIFMIICWLFVKGKREKERKGEKKKGKKEKREGKKKKENHNTTSSQSRYEV